VPPDAFAAARQGVMPEWQPAGLIEDCAHCSRGEAAAVHSTVEEVTGRLPRDVTVFAKDHANAFGLRTSWSHDAQPALA
jgi:hypothetical protein